MRRPSGEDSSRWKHLQAGTGEASPKGDPSWQGLLQVRIGRTSFSWVRPARTLPDHTEDSSQQSDLTKSAPA